MERGALPTTEHTSRPWRIHELTGDFRLEDVWGLSLPGHSDDLARTVKVITALDPERSSSWPVRALFALRWRLGELFGWDADNNGLGARVPSLRERLPSDLRHVPRPEFKELPFASLYLLEDEWAAEAANHTMHGVIHISRVSETDGGCRGQMAVLVKPNGVWGRIYMAAIRPFRHLIVYPPLLREIEREVWAPSETA